MIEKEPIQVTESKSAARSKLPEKEFFDREPNFDEPGNDSTGKWSKKRWFGVFLVGAALLLMFVFVSKGCSGDRSKSNRLASSEEKRETVTQSSMERAIQNSRPKEDARVEQLSNPRQLKSKERTFKSDIAVYLYEKKPQDNESKRSAQLKEARLGLPSGTKIRALLEDRVFSFNVSAPVLAIVPKDFKWDGKTIIPKGSKFLGEANVLKSLDRINVSFDLLILPDGSELRVRAMALAEDGASGIRGKVDKHGDTKILKAIGETLLGGASLFVGGTRSDPYSLNDQLRTNLAQNLTNQAAQDLRDVRVDKSVTVEASTPVQVMILEAI
jgi:type IV secretory pathway VirB10-like protein